jgi:hypothetical protein
VIRSSAAALLAGATLVGSSAAFAQFQMPDPRQMAGIPRPVDDLPDGSLSVRLIRGALSNNIANHPIELHVGDRVLTADTDEGGRAQFDRLPAGATLKAVAVVDGERLESQEFPAPARGGIRLMLVATDRSQRLETEPSAAPVPGQVSLGGESRIVVEPADESLRVYYLLEIVNAARVPVAPTTPFAFGLPDGAVGTTLLEGSSPIAVVDGPHVRLTGPLPPGRTLVQVGCELPVTRGSMDVVQTFPARLERLLVLVRKVDGLTLRSAQIERQQDFPDNGETIIGAVGGPVGAGQPIVLSLAGLRHHSLMPRRIALSLAAGIVLAGVWLSSRRPDGAAGRDEHKRLVQRREKLFAELVRLERDRRAGRGDPSRHAARREEIVASLEQVYGALDSADGRDGVAA